MKRYKILFFLAFLPPARVVTALILLDPLDTRHRYLVFENETQMASTTRLTMKRSVRLCEESLADPDVSGHRIGLSCKSSRVQSIVGSRRLNWLPRDSIVGVTVYSDRRKIW